MTAPELAILSNEAALHSLKRPQLLALCKQHGIKGSGKNVDLIARLEERGRFLATCSPEKEDIEVGDGSTASWAIVRPAEMADEPVQPDFGPAPENPDSCNSTAGSSGSMASTLRSAGTAFLRTIRSSTSSSKLAAPTEPESTKPPMAKNTTTGIYPSLSAFQLSESPSTAASSPATEISDTRLISPESGPPPASTANPNAVQSTTYAPFVFGSPVKDSGPEVSKAFTFAMPGTLFASTSSTNSEQANSPEPTAIDAVMEEMTRRAAEARAVAEASGIKRSSSVLFGSSAGHFTSSQGKKTAFDASHKRTFDKMDSITNHWAAKRSVQSSMNLAGMARSTSQRKIGDEGSEPQAKRAKSTALLQDVKSKSRDDKMVAALRDSGWSTSADQRTAVSLSASVRSGVSSLSRSRNAGKPIAQSASQVEQARRRRQLELATARRKSGASNGIGLSKRRPSLGVGPKASKMTPASLYRATVRKLQAAPPVPPLPPQAHLSASSATPTGSSTPVRPYNFTGARPTPRFAAPTASTSSRAALTAAATPIGQRNTHSPEKPPARKRADLQESLKRPMTWKSHLCSPAVTRASENRSPVTSTATASMPSAGSKDASPTEKATIGKLLALPQAPTSPFAFPAAALSPMASGAVTSAPPSISHPTASWQPPNITKKPLQPITPKPAQPSHPSFVKPNTVKKTVSTSSRTVRGQEKTTARQQLGGLETHARMVRAKAAAARARAKPSV
ncbi:hypothetical protein JCM10908_006708 [Rhodotorula pacifica]|uniref:uncharacterized protein n=1 Tax=Rhodotorula pacifica TaxID=1495444 RepID=UPI003181E49A